jgi:ribosomal protein L15E
MFAKASTVHGQQSNRDWSVESPSGGREAAIRQRKRQRKRESKRHAILAKERVLARRSQQSVRAMVTPGISALELLLGTAALAGLIVVRFTIGPGAEWRASSTPIAKCQLD